MSLPCKGKRPESDYKIVFIERGFVPDMSETKAYKEYKPGGGMPNYGTPGDDEFMNIPDGIDEELPFN